MKLAEFKSRLRKNFPNYQPPDDLAFKIGRMLIEARMQVGITQGELANMVGTQQAVISRLESGQQLPRMELLEKIVLALGMQLKISFLHPTEK